MSGFTSNRTSAAHAINYEEALGVYNLEAKRGVETSKKHRKLIDYSVVHTWIRACGIQNNFFTDIPNPKIFCDEINKVQAQIISDSHKKVAQKDLHFIKLLKQVEEYLTLDETPEKSDLIFVFGSKNQMARIDKAVELWKKNLAPVVWISGGHPVYDPGEAEAVIYKKIAIEQGVPAENIGVEPNSITITDNVKRSLNMMDEKGIPHKCMILVIGWYAQKRAWSVVERYTPHGTTLFNVMSPTPTSSLLCKERWMETEFGLSVIFNEFVKMRLNDYFITADHIL